MKIIFYSLALLFLSVICSPAPTVNFSSPPFNPNQFIVNQAANDISIKNSSNTVPKGVYPIKIMFLTGTNYWSIDASGVSNNYVLTASNGVAIWMTNSGAGGTGGGTLTNALYTNAGPADTYVVGPTVYLKTNNFGGISTLPAGVLTNFDTRAWTNSSGGISDFTGDLVAQSFATVAGVSIGSDLSWGGTSMGNGAGITALNATELNSGTVPVARLPLATTGAFGAVKPDGTSITISGGVISSAGGATGANPTATASDAAVNGVATTFMRSDGAPAIQKTSSSLFGLAKVDGTTISASGGVISAIGSASTVTNIAGGTGITNTQTGGTNFISITSIVVTNGIYTNAGPNIVINNTLFLNTNNFGGTVGGITALTGGVTATGPGSAYANASWITFQNGIYTTNFNVVGGIWETNRTTGAYTHILGNSIQMTNVVTTEFLSSSAGWFSYTNPLTLNGLLYTNGALFMFGGFYSGSGSQLTALNASALVSGTVDNARLGTGAVGAGLKFLSDDHTFKTIAGDGGITNVILNLSGLTGAAVMTTTNATLNLTNASGAFASSLAGGIIRGYFMAQTNITTTGNNNGSGASVADMNGDGLPDVVVSGNTGLSVYTNSGNGTVFPRSFNLATFTVARGNTLVDVNGDGRIDILICDNTAGTVSVYTNKGDATFVIQGTGYAETSAQFAPAGDFNGDGKPDFIAVASVNTQTPTVYTNTGTGLFVASTNLPAFLTGFYSKGVIASDLNGDGTNDLAFCPLSQNVVIIMTNNGAGVFQYWTTNAIPGPMGVVAADVNNDGRKDLLEFSGNGNGSVSVLTNAVSGNGFGIYSSNVVLGASSGMDLVAADWNADGLIDYAVSSHAQDSFFVLTNSGIGVGFNYSMTNATAIVPDAIGTGDFNRDGFPDIMSYAPQGSPTPVAQIWLNSLSFNGRFNGDAVGLTNGQMTLAFGSANTWAPATNNLGTLNLRTNYPIYNSTFSKVAINGDGGSVTNVAFVTTSAATSGTVTSLATHQIEYTYMNSGSTIISMTWALPAASTIIGRTYYLHTKSAITTLTVTGGSFADTLPTTMTAGSTIGYTTVDGSGAYIKIQ